MSDKIKPTKPEGVPRYYSVRGIKAVPGHDWQFDDTQNSWVWKADPLESTQFVGAEEKFSEGFIRVAAKKEDYGTIRYKGKRQEVWENSKGEEYIILYDEGKKVFLKPDWWSNPEKRKDASLSVDRIVDTEYEKKKKWPGLPSLPSLPSLPKLEMPDIKLTTPEISAGAKAGIGLVVLFIVGVIALIAIGYSGIGESIGRVGEKEYSRKRK